MTKDEALNLALEALEFIPKSGSMLGTHAEAKRLEAIAAIKEALAQTEQPKVRTGDCLLVGVCASEGHKIAPQRTWVGLTNEEKQHCIYDEQGNVLDYEDCVDKTEAKLKEKNI